MPASEKQPERALTPKELAELGWLSRWYERQTRERNVMCTGKHAFDTFDAAAQTIRKESQRRETEPYRCKVCHQWHVGNARATRERRLKFFKQRREDHR